MTAGGSSGSEEEAPAERAQTEAKRPEVRARDETEARAQRAANIHQLIEDLIERDDGDAEPTELEPAELKPAEPEPPPDAAATVTKEPPQP